MNKHTATKIKFIKNLKTDRVTFKKGNEYWCKQSDADKYVTEGLAAIPLEPPITEYFASSRNKPKKAK